MSLNKINVVNYKKNKKTSFKIYRKFNLQVKNYIKKKIKKKNRKEQ